MNNQQNSNLQEMLKLFNSNKNKDNLLNSIKSNLSDEQKSQVQNIMKDKEKLNKLLKSPEAIELLKRLNQKK